MARKGKRARGEGSIYKRSSDGRWTAALTLPDGSRKTIYGETQAEVSAQLAQLRRDRDVGLPVATDERRTVASYLESWLEMRKPSLRPGAHANFTWYVAHYIVPYIGRVKLSKLSAEQVQRMLAQLHDRGLAPSTIRYAHSVLRNALNEAVRLSIIPRNVALLVKKPRERRVEMKCWDPEQTLRFLDAARDDRLFALYVVALSTGMREGELLALRWRDVSLPANGSAGSIRVQHTLHWRGNSAGLLELSLEEVKTERGRRKIDLSAEATQALREHRARQKAERLKLGPIWRDYELVFCNTIGGGIHASPFRTRMWAPLIEKAGVPYIRPYDMRHTAATLLLLDGVPVKVVSEMLGHASVAFTMTTYAHVLPAMQQGAAASMGRLLSRLSERRSS